MNSPIKKVFHGEFFRFLLVGGSNTLLGYVLYFLFLYFMPYLYAYTLSYCIGIVFAYVMNSRFVFRKPMSLARFLQFPVVYVIQYGLGVAILWLLVGRLAIAPELAMLGVVAATIPITFLTSRFILKR
jgi:putative flippase GtrA